MSQPVDHVLDRALAGMDFPDQFAGDWHVLHTRSRQEKILSDCLRKMGIAHFLPLMRRPRYYGNRKIFVELPLYSGYLFLRGSLDDAYRADRTNRIAGIIPVADQEQLDWELRNIHLAIARNATLDVFPYLVRGTRVEVRSGPFRGLQGIVENRSGPTRLVLQVETLGRAVSLEIDSALLDQIDRAS